MKITKEREKKNSDYLSILSPSLSFSSTRTCLRTHLFFSPCRYNFLRLRLFIICKYHFSSKPEKKIENSKRNGKEVERKTLISYQSFFFFLSSLQLSQGFERIYSRTVNTCFRSHKKNEKKEYIYITPPPPKKKNLKR